MAQLIIKVPAALKIETNFQISGQESNVINSTCNENGIRELKFKTPHGPTYHYKEATNTSFGDQPHLTDPLDKKYVYVKESTNFESAGEGVHASRTIQEGTAQIPLQF